MKVSRTNKIILSCITVAWLLIGVFIFSTSDVNANNEIEKKDIYKKLRVFNEILFKLNENYVTDLKLEDLIDAAIEGMLTKVDPHTVYLKKDGFEQFTTNTKGEFGGLGISIDKQGDYITVISPIFGTPAYRLGIIAGDKIVKVDGDNVVGISTEEVIKKMRGPKGSKVMVTISRPGVKEELDFEIIREIIKIHSISYSFKLPNDIGYIRIRQFNANTTDELREALDELEAQDIKGLLIDLRFNPGGLLSEAVNTVNEFIGPDKRVVFTKGRNSNANQELFTRYNTIRTGYPVIALIDEGTASAAEIFAGSLQDYDKGLVVGEKSFGKGSVQQLFQLSDGGIKITTAKYYINSGRCIHKDINDRILRGQKVTEKEKKDIEKENKQKTYETVNGRTVYGGGGINPDVVIKSGRLTDLGVKIRIKNLVFDYSVDYMQKHENDISEDFEVSDALIEDFAKYMDSKEIKYRKTELDSTKSWLKSTLKSNIISKKFGDKSGYKAGLDGDTQLQEVLRIFDKYPTIDKMFEYADTNKK